MDMGWEANLMGYVPYGGSGGAKGGKEITVAIMAARKGDIESEYHKPTLIMGDLNCSLSRLPAILNLIQNGWIDVGHDAHMGQRARFTHMLCTQ